MSQDKDLGHATTALNASHKYAEYVEGLSAEEKRRLFIQQIKGELDRFGKKFLDIVFSNQKYALTEEEKRELRDYMAQRRK